MVSTIIQLGGVLVLAGLFVLLRRFVLRRAYFVSWTLAYVALATALVAVVLRYNVLPATLSPGFSDAHPAAQAVYYLYQGAKLAAFVWFVDGTRVFATGERGLRHSRLLWVLAAVYTVVSVSVAGAQAGIIVWQAPVAVAAFGYCAWLLLLLPARRRTAGSVTAGSGFLFLSALWTTYAVVFALVARGRATGLTDLIVVANPYLDLAGGIALGYGMIIALMEDAKREVDDAQAALRAAHDELRRAALYDPLTGVMNRSAYTEGLGLDMARASFGTVVLVDLDNLKQVNDEFGHAGGDMLLRACADTLRAALRQTDRLYRWGGDEFLLVLPSARAVDVQTRIERVVAEAAPLHPGSATVRLAASVGAADFASYDDLRAAIDRADTLMYRQKHARKRAAGALRTTPAGDPAVR